MDVEKSILEWLQRSQSGEDVTGWEEYASRFLGFGSWNAPIWFVGIEEAGSPDEMPHRLEYARAQGGEWLWDLAEANAFGFGVPIDKNQPTWTSLLKALVRAVVPDLSGPALHECALGFQSEHFARRNSRVSVIDLFALPKVKSDVLDEQYLGSPYGLISLESYYQTFRNQRVELLKQSKRPPRRWSCSTPTSIVRSGRQFLAAYSQRDPSPSASFATESPTCCATIRHRPNGLGLESWTLWPPSSVSQLTFPACRCTG